MISPHNEMIGSEKRRIRVDHLSLAWYSSNNAALRYRSDKPSLAWYSSDNSTLRYRAQLCNQSHV